MLPRGRMQVTLTQLCDTLVRHGMQPELVGDAQRIIRGVATLDEARDGDVTFLSNPKYEKLLQSTAATAVVVKPEVPATDRYATIRVADPYAAITVLIVELHGYRRHRQAAAAADGFIHETARIGENASIYAGATIDEDVVIGANAIIYPGCYIGPRSRIGDNVLLYPNVVIYDDTLIGNRVTIHSGSVIAEDGLGYAPIGGKWIKIPQIGEHCMFVAQVGLAGSVSVGDRVTMAGQAGVVGHIRIGDDSKVGAKAGVTNNVPDGVTVLGQPAIPIRDMRRQMALVGKLPELNDTVRRLEKRVVELEAQLRAAAKQGSP